MPVWKNAIDLSIRVFQISSSLPRAEDYGLTSQIRRSANSINANIAEGFGRRTNKDKIHFYTISRGSAYETQSHLLYGHGVKYFEDDIVQELFKNYCIL